ncbi:uncharacterized protein GIQ15_05639 [Arthroderma uncinatum]|uniref:uncharacterized protein n=1 Tax=Arthroderma uncinatum TaxID=74035 RepID=UPI00144A957A|nr:uncharacterized protein GIQ15_05639 [Arthroderma uncinatum]KAF3480292.1 hypothetical protein GIQ15_05639 [Arthroderma uncinatum]
MLLSVENGVLSAGSGSFWSKCLEIKLNRGFACEDARTPLAAGYSRVARNAASVDSEVYPGTALMLYDTTLARVYRNKLTAKTRKTAPKTKPTGKSIAQENEIENKLKLFVELDGWRYTTLPVILRERAADNEDKKKKGGSHSSNGYIIKDELVRLMDWKLKHGSFRPALMGLIRSNQESQVESASKDAFSKLAEDSATGKFPESSMQLLCKSFRGVGPATASLVLSLAPHSDTYETPFFSDELYYWLCLDLYSSPKPKQKQILPKLKYNIKEYTELWDAFSRLRQRIERLSGEEKASNARIAFSTQDIEKIAFVVGHPEATGPDRDDSKVPSKPDDQGDAPSTPSLPTDADPETTAEKDQGRRTRKRKRQGP